MSLFAAELEESEIGISDTGLSTVENILGKQKMLVTYQDFLLFLQCFQRLCFSGSLKVFFSLPNNTYSDWSLLKVFADDKLKVTEKLKFVLERVENIVGKGENAGNQHFLLFPQCFLKASLEGSLKVSIVW